MNKGLKRFLPVLALLLASTPLPADDVTGSNKILCTPMQATRCFPDGECKSGPPWNLNIPLFVEIDLEKKTLSTTKASGQNRSTPIKTLERGGGLIFLQGIEGGRAYSFVITEETGLASIAVAKDDASVAVFGACTPR
jgi:hypothetical protein